MFAIYRNEALIYLHHIQTLLHQQDFRCQLEHQEAMILLTNIKRISTSVSGRLTIYTYLTNTFTIQNVAGQYYLVQPNITPKHTQIYW